MPLHHGLRDRAAEPTAGDRLLGGDDAGRLPRGRDHGVDVQRPHRRHRQYAGRNALRGEPFRGGQGPPQHRPVADHCHVAAFANRDRLAEHERVVVGVHLRHAHPADPDEHRPFRSGRPAQRGRGFDRVRRDDDGQPSDRAQPGDVLDRMMRRAEFSVRDAGTHPAEFHVRLRVRDVGLDLFERAPGEEAGCRRDERDPAAVRQPGRDADHVLLGDPDVDQPVRERLPETVQLARSDRVVDHANDPMIRLGKLGQRFHVRVPAVVARLIGNRSGLQDCHCSSSRACWYSAASGTRWCQATLLLMNEIGWPLCVWAITKVGLPGRNGTADSTSSSSP